MKWHIAVRAGDNDSFSPEVGQGDGCLFVGVSRPGSPDRMREQVLPEIGKVLGALPSDPATDLLNIAFSVYAADVSAPRACSPDGWTRSFVVYVPVYSESAWRRASRALVKTLSFLSGDEWQFEFRGREDRPNLKLGDRCSGFDTACLFSGGLDSLVGAVDLLAQGKRPVLIGHYGGGTTSKFQREVFKALCAEYPDAALALRFQVLSPELRRVNGDPDPEDTQRSRSFLFFALGLAVADAVGPELPLFVPENGLISLNVPMTGARSGSASTRTTHPYYVKCYREVLDRIGLKHPLVLPYRFMTKAEMLKGVANPDLLKRVTPLSISCAHPDQRRREGLAPGAHCGHCYPCLIRRATVAAAGLPDAPYDLDVLGQPPRKGGKKGQDFRALKMAIARFKRTPANKLLFDVLRPGPLEPSEVSAFVEIYRRGMAELVEFYG